MVKTLVELVMKLLRKSDYPDTMTCPDCHWEMSLISIEMGYTCHNPVCKLHVQQGVLA